MTGVRESTTSRPVKSSKSNEVSESLESQKLELPLITKKAVTDADIFPVSIINEEPKSMPKYKSRLKQYGGMIDAAKLVEEKSQILNKKITNSTRADLFPMGHIDFRRPRRNLMEDPMKLKASPAHSHRFMENMLLKALKKAGYD